MTTRCSSSRSVEDLQQMEQMRETWSRLASASGNPFIDFDYQFAWASGLTEDQALRVIVSLTDGVPTGVAPLVENRKSGILTLIAAEMYEMQDLPYEVSATGDLARSMCKAGRPIFLKRVNANSPVIAELESGRARCLFRMKPVAGSPFLNLTKEWLNPESNLNSGRRSDIRRMRRIATETGNVTVDILTPKPEEVGDLLARVFAVEASGWKGEAGSALQFDQQRSAFFQRLSLRMAKTGRLHVFFYRIGGEYAAAQLAMQHQNRFWLLRAGYDERFSRCSPGMLLTVESLRFAAEQGLSSYEFCGSVEPWTKIWTKEEHPACSVFLCPIQIGSLAASVREFLL